MIKSYHTTSEKRPIALVYELNIWRISRYYVTRSIECNINHYRQNGWVTFLGWVQWLSCVILTQRFFVLGFLQRTLASQEFYKLLTLSKTFVYILIFKQANVRFKKVWDLFWWKDHKVARCAEDRKILCGYGGKCVFNGFY